MEGAAPHPHLLGWPPVCRRGHKSSEETGSRIGTSGQVFTHASGARQSQPLLDLDQGTPLRKGSYFPCMSEVGSLFPQKTRRSQQVQVHGKVSTAPFPCKPVFRHLLPEERVNKKKQEKSPS